MAYRPKYEYLTKKEDLKAVIKEHKNLGSVRTSTDNSLITIYLERALNELKFAEVGLNISQDNNLKTIMGLQQEDISIMYAPS